MIDQDPEEELNDIVDEVNQVVAELHQIENANYAIDTDFDLDKVFPNTFNAFDQYLSEFVQVNADGKNPSYFPEDGILFDAKMYTDDPNRDAEILSQLEKQLDKNK
jgi:hypothetical protein